MPTVWPLNKVGSAFAAVLTLWLALAILFSAGLYMCAWPWSKACYLTFWDGVAAVILLWWVDDPETLITGVLALAAACLGAYLLNRQIGQTERLEAERQLRRFRAVRASTPLVLSEICDYAEQQAKAWMFAVDRLQEHPVAQALPREIGGPPPPRLEDVRFPSLAPSIVVSLKDMVEAAADEAAAEPYMVLLNEMQVLIARSRGFAAELVNAGGSRVNTAHYCLGQVLESAELYARAARLFDLTRAEDALARHRIYLDEINTALFSMGFHGNDRGARELGGRYYKRRPGGEA